MSTETGFRHDVADAVFQLPVATAFGFTFAQLADGHAEAHLPWRVEHSHIAGAFQAGPIATLADFTGVAAGVTLLPTGGTAATVDYTAKFLAEARGELLIARARVLHPGTTLTVATVDVYAATNTGTNTETLCATALVTMRNLVPSSARRTPPAATRAER